MDIVVPHLIRKASGKHFVKFSWRNRCDSGIILDVSVSETSSFKEESEGDVKVIVMAVLIPICAIVILISGVILICHFHPDASKRWLAVLKGRKRCKRKADVADCVTKFTRHSLVFPQFKNAGDRPERIQVPAEMFPAGERPKSVRCKSVSDEKQLEDQHENQTSQPAETVLPTSVKRDPDG